MALRQNDRLVAPRFHREESTRARVEKEDRGCSRTSPTTAR